MIKEKISLGKAGWNMKNEYVTFTIGKKKNITDRMIQIISRQLRDDSDYAYIRHYLIRYQNVPLWVMMNVLIIGQLSKMYYCQKGRIKIKVCQEFGPLKINEMGKMLSIMTKFRNVCAQ